MYAMNGPSVEIQKKTQRCHVHRALDVKINNDIREQKISIDQIPSLKRLKGSMKRGDCVLCSGPNDTGNVLLMYLDPDLIQYSQGKGMSVTNLYCISEFPPKYWSEVDEDCLRNDKRIVAKMRDFYDQIINSLDDIQEVSFRMLAGSFIHNGEKYAYLHKFTSKFMNDSASVYNAFEARLLSKQPEIYSYVNEEDLSTYLKKYFIENELDVEHAIMATN
ncbi:unnamed protein product [Sphagnum troendelagicum]